MKLAAVFGALLLASACSSENDAPEVPPVRPARNVVLVVIDALRADHVGAWGYERATTPRLDALAADGVRFERAYAASSNPLQSYASLWTGRLPLSGGAIGLFQAAPRDELLSLPRCFLRSGFRTALVSNQPGLRDRGFTRGFDDVEVDSEPGRWSGAAVTAKALELVDAAGGAPLFLVACYSDATEPHLPSEARRAAIDVPPTEPLLSLGELRASAGALPEGVEALPAFGDLVARYDAEIATVDASLGALVDGLAERGVLDDTLVVVTSSFGVEFLEHGYVGTGWTLYEEVLRVPLVVYAPALLAPRVESRPVSLVDVVPSLAHALGLDSGSRVSDGNPFLSASRGALAVDVTTQTVLAELVVPEHAILRAAIEETWKGISRVRFPPPSDRLALMTGYEALLTKMQDGEIPRPDPLGPARSVEVFDLARDPSESVDLSDSREDLVAWLEERVARYLERCRTDGLEARAAPRPAELPDPESLGELEALGYL